MSALEKARIFAPDKPKAGFHVQFNPNTLEYSAGLDPQSYKGTADRGERGGAAAVDVQGSPLASAQGAILSVRLFCHTYVSHDVFTDVRTDINRIRAFLPCPAKGTQAKSPRMTFAWGTMTHTGTLESFSVSYQMFAHDGTPVQAEVSITIRGEDPDVSSASADQALSGPQTAGPRQQDGDSIPVEIAWLF